MIQYKKPRIQKLIILFNKHKVMENKFIPIWKKMSIKQLDNLIKKMESIK